MSRILCNSLLLESTAIELIISKKAMLLECSCFLCFYIGTCASGMTPLIGFLFNHCLSIEASSMFEWDQAIVGSKSPFNPWDLGCSSVPEPMAPWALRIRLHVQLSSNSTILITSTATQMDMPPMRMQK